MNRPGTATLELVDVLTQLRQAKIHYEVKQHRTDAITVEVVSSGERWEIDFLHDGEIEIEILRSDGQIFDESKFSEMIREYSN